MSGPPDEHATALAVQRTLLPAGVRAPEGLELAYRYRPGDGGVGGDWFDVIALSAGRAALVVGDVSGKGLAAAAVMAQVRGALRAYGVMDLPPASVLAYLDGLVRDMGEETIVRCVYAVYDPAGQELAYANAGHVPPAVVRVDGTVALLNGATGAALGVGGVGFSNARTVLAAGTTVVLYTDGVVATPDDAAGITAHLAGAAAAGVDGLAERLAETSTDGRDDRTVLVARTATTPAAPRIARRRFDADLSEAREARRWAAGLIELWQATAVAEPVALLVTELVTNAIRHAGTSVDVRLRLGSGSLFVEAIDGDPRLPRLRPTDPDSENGRGLHLLEALSQRWGARLAGSGKVVWFELRLDG